MGHKSVLDGLEKYGPSNALFRAILLAQHLGIDSIAH
jgi:hypothetical protein